MARTKKPQPTSTPKPSRTRAKKPDTSADTGDLPTNYAVMLTAIGPADAASMEKSKEPIATKADLADIETPLDVEEEEIPTVAVFPACFKKAIVDGKKTLLLLPADRQDMSIHDIRCAIVEGRYTFAAGKVGDRQEIAWCSLVSGEHLHHAYALVIESMDVVRPVELTRREFYELGMLQLEEAIGAEIVAKPTGQFSEERQAKWSQLANEFLRLVKDVQNGQDVFIAAAVVAGFRLCRFNSPDSRPITTQTVMERIRFRVIRTNS